MNEEGEVRPQGGIYELCSDISKNGGICEIGSDISCYLQLRPQLSINEVII